MIKMIVYDTEYLASLVFPNIVADTKGYTTNHESLRSISESETESFSEKIKYLTKSVEN